MLLSMGWHCRSPPLGSGYSSPGTWKAQAAAGEKAGSAVTPEQIQGRPFCLDGLPLRFRRCGGAGRVPNLARRLRDEAQLGLLVGLGQQISLQRGGEPALRAQSESFEGNKLLRGADAALELVLALQSGLFRTDQAQDDGPVVRNLNERFETTRPLIIEFQQESLEFGLTEDFGDRSVIARGVELALIVSPAQVQAKQDAGMTANHSVIHLDGEIEEAVGITAPLLVALADLGIDQGGILRRVDLNVRAAQSEQFGYLVTKEIDEIGEKSVNGRVGAAGLLRIVVGRRLLRADQRRLGRMIGPGAQVGELLGAHGAFPAQSRNDNRPRMRKFLASFVAEWDRPAPKFVEPFHSVNQVPIKGVSPHLAVGQDLNAGSELQVDRCVDSAVLQALEFRVGQFPGRKLHAGILQVRGAQ